ncbi:ABC transporter, ATP-binding protein [Methanosarcina barkeri 227]|nr:MULTISPECIES: hypothetical protein [Methanosarcina]AKB57834.1 ABC transporter, ATP-binding protein [Methanosarcina barkeri 227]AKJ38381.1 dipeptide/oligopeptide/nickel ABC transporter ATP-binding protein [Methanosarcina barkeri CM1]
MSLLKTNDFKCHYLTNISRLKGSEFKHLEIGMQMIFQNPKSSLNPRMKIYGFIAELLRLHRLCERDEEKA